MEVTQRTESHRRIVQHILQQKNISHFTQVQMYKNTVCKSHRCWRTGVGSTTRDRSNVSCSYCHGAENLSPMDEGGDWGFPLSAYRSEETHMKV